MIDAILLVEFIVDSYVWYEHIHTLTFNYDCDDYDDDCYDADECGQYVGDVVSFKPTSKKKSKENRNHCYWWHLANKYKFLDDFFFYYFFQLPTILCLVLQYY